jgi:hypothetical protein
MKNDKVNYTSVSELISELQDIKDKHGDLPVCVQGSSPIWTDLLAYYYDGGFVLQDVNDSSNYIRSRTWDPEKKLTVCTEGFPKKCINLMDTKPHEFLCCNGRPIREIDPESWQFLDEKEQEERNIFGGQFVKFRNTQVYNPDMKCYPYEAYLDSGESAIGPNMFEARENLKKIYTENKNGPTYEI